jgi:hypothetical protein
MRKTVILIALVIVSSFRAHAFEFAPVPLDGDDVAQALNLQMTKYHLAYPSPRTIQLLVTRWNVDSGLQAGGHIEKTSGATLLVYFPKDHSNGQIKLTSDNGESVIMEFNCDPDKRNLTVSGKDGEDFIVTGYHSDLAHASDNPGIGKDELATAQKLFEVRVRADKP